MLNIVFNIPLYVTGITTYIYIYTELAPKLTATDYVPQPVERWSRDPGSRFQFPVGGLGVAFSATHGYWSRFGLKMYISLTVEFTLL